VKFSVRLIAGSRFDRPRWLLSWQLVVTVTAVSWWLSLYIHVDIAYTTHSKVLAVCCHTTCHQSISHVLLFLTSSPVSTRKPVLDQGQTDRITALLIIMPIHAVHWHFDLDLWPWLSIQEEHTHKLKFSGQSVQKIEWKQTEKN